MFSQVIALFEGRNYITTIELTEERKCVVITRVEKDIMVRMRR